jgi:hypothetical protein
MGLILDSSVVIAAERVGQTAYQMLEDIDLSVDSESDRTGVLKDHAVRRP